MKPDHTVFEKTVHRHLSLLGSPSVSQVEASRGRIHERLRAHHEAAQSGAPPVGAAGLRYAWRVGVSLAAAATVIVLVVTAPWQGTDWLATVEAADGSRYSLEPNALLRSNDAGGMMLTLKDGSHVEMRSHSELALARAADGIGIRLRTGALIVNAAKQQEGHLYLHTKDMTVAVVGTIFAVNAEDSGSRVTVIEGEVRVREGTIETRLRSGEQISTSAALAARPVKEEISWSRHADAHLAILDSFTKGMARTAGALAPVAAPAQSAAVDGQVASTEFEEASIRECDPDNLPPSLIGARGGGANSVMVTPGRYYALCVTPATPIRTSHGYRAVNVEALIPDPLPRGGRAPIRGRFGVVGSLGAEDGLRVRGGPDWVRNERYTIEAIADSTADAATMSGPMLRALFARRFKLKTHVETEQTTAYNLVVAPGGLKIKPAAPGACEMPVGKPGAPLLNGMPQPTPRTLAEVRRAAKPPCGISHGPNGPNWVTVGGEATFDALTQVLRGRLGGAIRGIGVTDKTGITDKFNWDLESAVDGNASALPSILLTGAADADVPRAPTIFDALEQQLGLRLEPVQVPREYLVIDAIEKPAPN